MRVEITQNMIKCIERGILRPEMLKYFIESVDISECGIPAVCN